MNRKAVKQLTEKGCIVESEVAESITDDDIERIKELDSTPMYLSEEMLKTIRSAESAKSSESEEKKVSTEETGRGTTEEKNEDPGDSLKEESSTNSVVSIKDTGRRRIDTKVEVMDEKDISQEEKDVPEFLQNYNDRYDRLKKVLTRRKEMRSATTIKRLERRDKGDEAATVGLVKSKYSTSNGKYIVELEDKTGTFKALLDGRDGERIVPDEVIGLRGSMGGDIIYADSVLRPDLPIPEGVNTTDRAVKAAYISDLHLGSKDTMERKLDRFAEWISRQEDIGYLVMAGDVVEGVGVYPDQDEELKVTDIYRQYELFEEWVKKLPEELQVIVSPGNHDIVRLAEPQPRIPEKALPEISGYDNVHLVQNPQMVRLHGIESEGMKHLMYHGYSFDEHADQIQELREKAYDDPHHVMIDLLKRRHLAPTFGSNLMAPGERDHMVIEEIPDVFVAGHFHSHANESYKGVNVICSSTFQAQTDFQKRVGHQPQPGLVTVMNFKNRKTEVKQF